MVGGRDVGRRLEEREGRPLAAIGSSAMDHDQADRRDDVPSSNGVRADPGNPRRIVTPVEPDPARHKQPTEDEWLLNRPVPPLPKAKAPELGSFTHTDPWRVLRIQGEFVNGFNALSEVGAGVAVF